MKKETRESRPVKTAKLNTEILLASLDEITYSIKKIDREIATLVRASAPKGYVCKSMECSGGSGHATYTAIFITERIIFLTQKKNDIRNLIAAVRKALLSISTKKVGYALYLRYQMGFVCDKCADIMKISSRHFYRLLNTGLKTIMESIDTNEIGKSVIENGIANFLHSYGK